MRNDDLQRIRTAISVSSLLSQTEKSEWLKFLPEMNDSQLKELERILSSVKTKPLADEGAKSQKTGTTPVSSQPQRINISTKPSPLKKGGWQMPDLKEKELDSGKISEKFEIPAKATPPPVAKPVVPPAPKPAAPAAPQPKNFPISSVITQASIVDETKESLNTPVMRTISTAASTENSLSKKYTSLPTVEVNTPDDLLKIDLNYLRSGGDPQLVLINLLKKITVFNQKYKFTAVIGKIEQSPLYKSYYNLGFSLLNESESNSSSGYSNYQKNASEHGQQSMTMEEFEAFTDFRKSLERILV